METWETSRCRGRRGDEAAKERARVFIQQAKRTVTFWNLIGIHYWGCMGHNIINVLIVAIAVDRGTVAGSGGRGACGLSRAWGVFARGAVPMAAERWGLQDGLGGGNVAAGIPAADHSLFAGRLGFLRVRGAAGHRAELRGAHVPHRQPAILWECTAGEPVRVAEPGQRPRNGGCAGVRGNRVGT